MRILRILLLLLLFIGSQAVHAQSLTPCPPNIDLVYGNFNNWSFGVGLSNCAGSCVNTSSPTPVFGNPASTAPLAGRHMITVGSGLDVYGGFPIVAPGGNIFSLRLGKDSAGYRCDRARYTIHVPVGSTDYCLNFKYAFVLNGASGHAAYEQPSFTIKGLDSATGATLSCADLSFDASTPGIQTSSSNSTVRYMPWTSGTLDLHKQAGKTIILEIAALSCGDGNHWAYGYFDIISCGRFKPYVAYCDLPRGIMSLAAPVGYANYKWYKDSITGSPIYNGALATINAPPPPLLLRPITIALLHHGITMDVRTRYALT